MKAAFLFCAAFGLIARAWLGSWVDLPVFIVNAAQMINAANFAAVFIAARMQGDEARMEKRPPRERAFVGALADDMLLAPPISVVVFVVVGVYEVFDFGFVAAAAAFPVFWIARAVVFACAAGRKK